VDTSPPTKRCTACGDLLPVDAFAWKDERRGWRRSTCRSCRRAYAQAWYRQNGDRHRAAAAAARRRRFQVNSAIVAAAKAVPCADCGGRFDHQQLDFDHVRGTKVDNVACLVWHAAPERVMAEIAKCEVVCAVCHRMRTRGRRLG
jgi:hypothetical protein